MSCIYIPFEPIAASRHRTNRRTGGTYYEEPYRSYLTTVRSYLDELGFTPEYSPEDYLHVDMDIVTPRTGDIDNFIKGVWDCCNGRLWDDDAQIKSVRAVLWHPDETDDSIGTYMNISLW